MMDKACCIFPEQNLPGSAWKDYDKLRKAVRSRDAGLVKRLIDGGALVNRRYDDYSENTPLHLAVTSRCLEIVKILLDNGANINATNAILDTPLTMAAKMEDTAIVDLLLSYNVHQYFNMRDNLGHLHVACMRNKLEVVRKLVLVDHGKTVSEAVMSSSLTWPGFTALHFAVYYGCTKTVKFLLECGVDIMVQDAKKLTPLQWADLRRNEEIIDLLLTAHKHEFKNPVSTNSLSHFHIACTRNDPLIVEHFLKLGADINLEVKVSESKFWQGWKPIHLAMYYDCPNVVNMLLNYKAQYEFSPMNRCQSRLLEYTFVTGNMSIYNLFANREKESEAIKEIEPISDFLLACMNNDYDYVEEWLRRNSRNSKYNDPFPCGCTPLHLTIKYDSYDAFKLLLAWDADITTQDPWGKTPLHAAFERKSPDFICKILSDVNDDTENVTDNFGLSILHILCITDYTELIEEFLLKGCDVNARVGVKSPQWAGSTPMHFAFEFEHVNQDEEFVEDVVRLLLKYKANIYIKNDSIFDHFDLIFHGMDKGGQLSEYEELLYKNLIKVLSSPTKQRKYSNCGVSPLHALCMNPFADIKTLKKFLISHGHVINQTIEKPESRRFHKCTPLHLALQCHDFVKAEVLLNAGADPLLINGNGNTPLECAFPLPRPLKMSEKVVKCLFQCGITIERLKPSHFFIACCAYIFEFVKHVLENLRDPTIRKYYLNYHNSVNQTALHTIALHKNLGEYDSAIGNE
ncbi:hypothetical protein QAD02_010081 [Eretmocerus hayati]|uniref:Uncharacterized protein n=1 Tax=Eretmocerus hayati TaxID=131215 RepID=A0ACC2NCB1_9HYME|nr:hypothetical protein QAD02_010081 [Eretmocerus hayati]